MGSEMCIRDRTKGTFLKITSFLKRIDAAISGRHEFFAPLISTVPFMALLGPVIINLFILF